MRNVKILFVCLGNICRSPTAEGVFQKKLEETKLDNIVQIDSAGTAGWHIGKSPDPRSTQAAAERGYSMSHLKSRQVSSNDFHHFDYILAMDEDNLADLLEVKPTGAKARVELFLDYAQDTSYTEVPDPYYGNEDGFSTVLDLVENASGGLLSTLASRGEI